MQKVTVEVRVKLVLEIKDGVSVDELMQEIDYTFTPSIDHHAKVVDSDLYEYQETKKETIEQGFKSDKKWDELAEDELCYKEQLAEDDEAGHTKQDLLSYVNGNEKTAKALYSLLEWQSPHTLLDEWRIEGEIDEEFNLIEG